MENSQIYKLVEKSINELCKKFKREPYFFMNEDDIKCYLYSLLINNKELRELYEKEGIKTNLLHSEFAYSGGVPDISIINKDAIKLEPINKLKPKIRLRSYAYEGICEDLISIELKHSWETPTYKRTKRFNKKLKEDFDKLSKSKIGRGYLIIFDVNGVVNNKLKLRSDNKVKLLYIGPKQIKA